MVVAFGWTSLPQGNGKPPGIFASVQIQVESIFLKEICLVNPAQNVNGNNAVSPVILKQQGSKSIAGAKSGKNFTS